MKDLIKLSVLLELFEQMLVRGSWCGETHIQKAVYFLQELTGIKTEYEYILYKHGPFSFDLRDELSALTANGLIRWVPQGSPYGPKCHVTDYGKNFKAHFCSEVQPFISGTNFVAEHLSDQRVAELERRGTALFLLRTESTLNASVLASRMHELKPHVSIDDASKAISDVETLEKEWLLSKGRGSVS